MKRLLNLPYLWMLPLAFWAVVLGVSLNYNLATINRQVAELASSHGRDVFHMIQAFREWNAEHGGVYVLQTPASPPNPYLDIPKRDLQAKTGERLTLVNPAYMTRQLAEVLLSQNQMRIRMSSLKPLNPVNRPDPWEHDALLAFEQGEKERAVISASEVRYMAPLMTEKNCLECHAKQGYELGQVRGGISVYFNLEAINRSVAPQKFNLYLIHGLAWVLLSGLGIFSLTRIRELMCSLDAARLEQEGLVEKRTAELQHEVRERRRAERRLHYLVDSTAQGMLGVDRAGNVTFCNRHAQELLASVINSPEILGHAIDEIFAFSPEFAKDLDLALRGVQTAGRLHLKHLGNGNEISLEYLLNAVHNDGQINGCVIALSDITEREQHEVEMWRQAHFDPLTALPNRTMLGSRMEAALQGGKASGGAVLFVDLDDFKPVNDRYGHESGDAVLVEVARRLQAEIRESDFAARIGGDEFVVVLGGARNNEDAAKVAEKILEALVEPISLGQGREARVTASIGIAMFPKNGQNIETLLRNADLAMYQAKERQKGSFGFYRAELSDQGDTPDTTNDYSV